MIRILHRTQVNKLQNFSTKELLNRELLLSKTFLIKPIDNKTLMSNKLESDLVEITENFNSKTPKNNAFLESGTRILASSCSELNSTTPKGFGKSLLQLHILLRPTRSLSLQRVIGPVVPFVFSS